MFCPSWVNKFVITVAHALTEGSSSIIACVLLREHPHIVESFFSSVMTQVKSMLLSVKADLNLTLLSQTKTEGGRRH